MAAHAIAPVETQPTVNQSWLWAARSCCALTFFLITVGLAFAKASRFDGVDLVEAGAGWWVLFLVLLFLVFRRGKKPLVVGLGMATMTGFFPVGALLLVGLGKVLPALPFLPLLLVGGVEGPWLYLDTGARTATSGVWWICWWICSLMLGVSAVVAYSKMRHEMEDIGRARRAFATGAFCGIVLSVVSSLMASVIWGVHLLGGLR